MLIDIKNFNTTNITNMGQMFSNCTSLKYIDFKKINYDILRKKREEKLKRVLNNKGT